VSNALFPLPIFTTQRRFNDFSTDDMRYGDIPEDRLRREFGLNKISNVVDPYTLTRLTAFDNPQLDTAYREMLHSDYAAKKTTSIMQETIGLFIDYTSKGFPHERLDNLTSAIKLSLLPKFDSLILDKINGMGITIHDVYATKIEILRLDVNDHGWKASVRFTGQDHFGLDVGDIRKQ